MIMDAFEGIGWQLTPTQTRSMWAHWLHIESVHVQRERESCRDIKKKKKKKIL